MEPTVNGCGVQLSPADQQVFDHLKCEVLEHARQVLTKNLLPDRHMDFLRWKRVLSEEDSEEVSGLSSRQKRASKLLDILDKKGAEAYDALCASLKDEGTQLFLLARLHKDFEQRLRRYRDLVGQQKSTQRLLSVSPPPIQPPPPPSHRQHHQGHDLQPTEDVYPGYLPKSSSHPSESRTGCSSGMSDVSSHPYHLTNGSSVVLTTDVGKEEGTETVDLQKERLNVAAYLQSLTIQQDESVAATVTISARELPPDRSLEQQLPTFLSSAATCGDSRTDLSHASLDQAASSAVSPTPPAATNDDGTVRRPQHHPLFSRGLEEGTCADPPSPPLLVSQCLEPVEHEDTSGESSSFFGSLGNESLAPSSSGNGSGVTILCDTALNDQQEALGKCLCSHTSMEEEEENIDNSDEKDQSLHPKAGVVGESEEPDQLPYDSVYHNTSRKTVTGSSFDAESAQSCDGKESLSSCKDGEDRQQEDQDVDKHEGLVFEEGMSKEARGSVHDKSGRGNTSTQC